MTFGWVALASIAWIAQAQITPVANVNSRYLVGGIKVIGEGEFRLSRAIQEDIQSLIGANLDSGALDDLADRIRKDLHARSVSYKIVRGEQPDQVKVNFEIARRSVALEITVPKFLYHSKEGWTGVAEATTTAGRNSFTFRLLSDGDELPERNTGFLTRYENRKVGSDRVRLGFQFESYHEKWNRATGSRLDFGEGAPGIYRTRQNFEPTITIVLAKPLTFTAGVSFERLQSQFPVARTESANAMVNTLRYHQLLQDSDSSKQVLDAGYSLRAATTILSSDFAYARHRWNCGYTLTRGRQSVLVTFNAGLVSGRPPLFEKYVLGNSSTLRGWNKYDIAPLGGSRMTHNSVEYRYRYFQIFYDAGAVWNRGEDATPRNSLGVGLRKDGFSLAVAFPLREGRADPVLIAGMNF